MKTKISFFFLIIAFLFIDTVYPQQSAKEILNKAFEAMGGRDKLESLKSIETESIGYRHWLEQYLKDRKGRGLRSYMQKNEIIDLVNNKIWRETKHKFGQIPEWSSLYTVTADGVVMMKRNGKEYPGRSVHTPRKDEEYFKNLTRKNFIYSREIEHFKI